MTLRKVLLATYHFPPSAAVAVHRMLGLVRYLPAHGWQPVVLAPPNMPGEPQDPALLKLVPEATPIYRVPLPRGFVGKVMRRFAPAGCWLPAARKEIQTILREHKLEAVLTTSPPSCIHYLGEHLKKKYALPWLMDLRDPLYVNNCFRRFRFGKYSWQARLEARSVKLADQVVANTPLTCQGLKSAYPDQTHKITVITNGYDLELAPHLPPRPVVDGELTLVHAGELYGGRDPRPLLDALKQLRSEQPNQRYVLRLLGKTEYSGFNLAREVGQRGLKDVVRLEGQVAHAQALQTIAAAHILLVVQTPGVTVNVPAKVYEYLGVGRPILALAEPGGDISWVLEQSGMLHRVVPAQEVSLIKQALKEMRREIETNGTTALPPRLFSRQHMAETVAQCLDACVTSSAPGRLSPSPTSQPC